MYTSIVGYRVDERPVCRPAAERPVDAKTKRYNWWCKMGRQSKAEIYLHFVWATWERMPLIEPDIEESLYSCIVSEAVKLKCTLLAIGGMPDHVHLLLKIPTTVCAAQVAQRVKGVSSSFGRDQLMKGGFFGWQDGYGVFSVSRSDNRKVIDYIDNQKEHHQKGSLWPTLERVEDDS